MRICEIFSSIQGEGLTMGAPTVFVRAVGCNLRCSWCDTGYSFAGGTEMSVDEILEEVGDCFRVCFTGGEPMLQPDAVELIERLVSKGIQVSGMTDRMLPSNLDVLSEKDQLKFIIEDGADLDFAVDFVRTHDIRSAIIFGPVGGTERLEQLVQRVLDEHLDIRVLPQLHKIIWGDRTGV